MDTLNSFAFPFEDLFHASFENDNTAKLIKINEGKIFAANNAACQMFGYTKDEFLLLERKDFVIEDSFEIARMKHASKEGKATGTMRFKKKDGTIFNGIVEVKTLKGSTGVKYSFFSFANLNESNALKKALAEKDKALNNILNFSRDVISVVDKFGKRIYTSISSYKVFGYTMEELLGKSFLDIVYEEDKEISKATFAKVFELKAIKTFQNRVVKKDGSVIYMSWSVNLDSDGDYMYVIGRDVTEIIKTEEALKESEKQYRNLIKNLKVGVIKQGINTKILLSNPAALEMLGLTEDQLLGKTSFHPNWNVIHENGDDFPGETHPVSVAIATKKSVHNVVMGVYRPVTKDRVWLLVNAEPEFNSINNLEHVIVTFSNITEQIYSQQALSATQKDLLRLNKNLENKSEQLIAKNIELEKFTYVASHDLKQPLRMVTSFIKLLDRKYGNVIGEQGKGYINFAVEGAEKMDALITDLLSYSQSGKRSSIIEDVDMNLVMDDVVKLFNNESYHSDADIKFDNLPTIKAGKIAITQLMQNLIGNSIKYKGESRAEIVVSGEENENEWIISIKDNGIGIAPEDIEKVFIMFQRLATKTKVAGTGIGLASCKKIVESYHGKIWVTSELGIGSIFKFSIPKNS